MESVDIRDVDLTFVGSVTLTEIYAYMSYLSRDRVLHPNSDRSAKGLNPTSRARKLATIRSFYGYLCNKVHKLDRNPVKDIDAPKLKKTLPRYLTLDESISLLESVDGPNREQDLCILTLFLNCGLRISELIGLNLSDVHEDALRVLGKGQQGAHGVPEPGVSGHAAGLSGGAAAHNRAGPGCPVPVGATNGSAAPWSTPW